MSCSSIKTSSTTIGAALAVQKFGEFLTDGARFSFMVAPLEIWNHAFEAVPIFDLHATRILIVEFDFFTAAAVQNNVL